jgi:N-acylneuraminate cytidylyltransferase/CMP-N,N'-diacetyllegionaminic acid synthase
LKILVVIPARGGSKSIPRKNLADVAGRPLLSYVIEAARAARRVEHVVVSTEDEEIARVAREWGAEVPFMRPQELARDEVSLGPVVVHALKAMDELGFRADAVLSAQPTSPFLEGSDFDAMVEKLETTGADSVVSVQAVDHEHPFWVKRLEGDRVRPFNEYTNESILQRQDLPPAFIFDGALFLRTRHVVEAWTGRDFGLGQDVRAIVLGGLKSLHIDDPLHLELVRVVAAERARQRALA